MEESEIQPVEEVLVKLPEDRIRSHGAGEGLSTCTTDIIKKTSAIMSIPEAIEFEGSSSEIKQKETKSEDTVQLSASRWTSLVRVFRVGLALDSAVPQNIKNMEPQSQTEEHSGNLSSDKRRSLGKLFRHGLKFNTKSFQSDSDFLADCPLPGYPEGKAATLQNKRGTLQRIFRRGKSSPSFNETSSTEVANNLNVDEHRLTVPSRKFALGMKFKAKQSSDTLDDMQVKSGGAIQHGDMSPIQLRRRSLGKLFRHSKDYHGGDFLASDHSKTSKNENATVSEQVLELPTDEAKKNEESNLNED